jgi:single-stranded-DNA-specific exonuclease
MTSAPCPRNPWQLAPVDAETVARLAAETGLSATTARVLAGRGVTTGSDVKTFLSPSLERDWLDPSRIPGLDAVADSVAEAVRSRKRIAVFGDFDLDGVSAAAVAARGLLELGADAIAFVPHRFNEGYGLSKAAIERLLEQSPEFVVTVDCGISSADEVALLLDRGVGVAVTDHHEPGALVPSAVAVADPKLEPGCPSADLAGAGVALKLIQAVGERLGHPNVWRSLTDLATLGTIADIVPLVGENRALVSDGLSRMRNEPRACIAALCAVSGTSTDQVTAESIAYGLAPRLNAAGRMADPAVALALLMTDDPARAEELALALDEHNRLRQAVEADLMAEADAQAASTFHEGDRALVLAGAGWHDGVKGIVASKLVGTYRVPAFLFSVEDGMARGSGRSVGSVDLFRALESVSDLLERYGGHAAAVGLALPAQRLDEFRSRIFDSLAVLPAEQFEAAMTVDAEVDLGDLGVELGAELSLLEPFGHRNPKPMLAVTGVFMNGRQKVGKNASHLRFDAFDGTAMLPAIAFRCTDIDELVGCEGAVDLAFELDVSEWRGRARPQLMIRRIVPRISEHSAAEDLVADLFARADEIIAREEYAGISDATAFHTKLVGVTFEGRQDVLGRLVASTPLRLERQPHNEYDPNACALFDPHGDQVGFFNRRLAAALAPSIDAGVDYDVEVTEVTGGETDRSLGVNVLVSRRDAVEDREEELALRLERRAELAAMPPEELDAELVRRFIGDRSLHAAQAESLSHLSTGHNTLTVMATGRGKSLIFHLHAARQALRHGAASVFVYPLRALVADQSFHLDEAFAEVGVVVRTLTGESSEGERAEVFEGLSNGLVDVVLTTPEFLHHHADRFASAGRIGFVVVDEAHHVAQARAGHRPSYAKLGEAIAALGGPTVLAVTATAGDDASDAICGSLGIDRVVADPTVRENLHLEDRRDIGDRDGYLAALAAKGEKIIVYVNSREQSVRLARMLRKRVPDIAFRTAFYNGGLARAARHAVEKAFRGSDVIVVVATSAFGEGVNIPDVRHVVLYHLPFGAVEFNQMCGRSGRDGADASVHLVFGSKDARINEAILSSLAPSRDDMAALYLVLKECQVEQGPMFEATNAELAQAAAKKRKGFGLDERGVSSAIGIFRELGLVESEGHGVYRRLSVVAVDKKTDLDSSVRYAEGLEEIEAFGEFRAWVLSAEAEDLLARFNRPILPTRR